MSDKPKSAACGSLIYINGDDELPFDGCSKADHHHWVPIIPTPDFGVTVLFVCSRCEMQVHQTRYLSRPPTLTIDDPEKLLEVDSLKMTVEEGAEIHAELCMAIAGFVGERLTSCDPCCPGHFGPAAKEFVKLGLENYRALEEGS